MPTETLNFQLAVNLRDRDEEEGTLETEAYAFDANGKFLARARVKNGKAKLALPKALQGRSIRLLVGPPISADEREPALGSLKRLQPLERQLRLDPDNLQFEFEVLEPSWRPWWRCQCVVRGRLVKRVDNPDGSHEDMPICHARVTICEVDRLPLLIERLPDLDLYRLRDEVIRLVREPLPIPRIPDPPFPPDPIDGPPRPPLTRLAAVDLRATPIRAATPMTLELEATERSHLRMLAHSTEPVALRASLVELLPVFRPWLCLWDWLEPWIRYHKDCFRTVEVDEQGRFETVIDYPCFGDRPDLYFQAEQLQGGSWVSIYRPSVRCHTHWDYVCGTEVILRVTSPAAVPCHPDTPVIPPPGFDAWVMPYAVGGTKIWGTPPGSPPAPAGWVRSDGYTDYSDGGVSMNGAPFGATLSFSQGHSNNIPDSGAKYYRWSWRRAGTSGDFQHLTTPVSRRYVKQSPGMLPSFPAYQLGPKTVGGSAEQNLFEFKPDAAPPSDPGDPAGTITYWPTDNFFGDIYCAFFDTSLLPPDAAGAAGQYEVRVEVFDAAGTRVSPGAGTFSFIVPTGLAADGVTIEARAAQPAEIQADGFVFALQVDNNRCTGLIDPPQIGASAVTDSCGFLRYEPGNSTPVTLSFEASHPNGHGVLNFNVVRGATTLTTTATGHQEVTALVAGAFTGDGAGHFSHGFGLAELMCGPAPASGCCTHAAFAESLYVRAKATTGFGNRIGGYDAADLRAFALAPVDEE